MKPPQPNNSLPDQPNNTEMKPPQPNNSLPDQPNNTEMKPPQPTTATRSTKQYRNEASPANNRYQINQTIQK